MTKESKKGKAEKKAKKRDSAGKLSNRVYEAELFRLQTEFVKLQEWVKHTGGRASWWCSKDVTPRVRAGPSSGSPNT